MSFENSSEKHYLPPLFKAPTFQSRLTDVVAAASSILIFFLSLALLFTQTLCKYEKNAAPLAGLFYTY